MVCGVEAHVCVYLTTQDFLALGYTLHVVVDCTSSRNQVDRMFAYDRMKQMGAFLNTAESVRVHSVYLNIAFVHTNDGYGHTPHVVST